MTQTRKRRDWIDLAIFAISLCSGFAFYVLLSRYFNAEFALLESYCDGWRDWNIVEGVLLEGPKEWRDHCRVLTRNLHLSSRINNMACGVLGYGLFRLIRDVMFWRDPAVRSKT
ncbi:MAG: hypothetical protein ABJZ83_05410 [Yoonia sp.]|uniref:hypothetical protein n=1 Tax=Yoonia sp. TaxID=2212373 RepID=UPI0032970442